MILQIQNIVLSEFSFAPILAMKESLSEPAMLNAIVADYLCSKAPKIGAKFKVCILLI